MYLRKTLTTITYLFASFILANGQGNLFILSKNNSTIELEEFINQINSIDTTELENRGKAIYNFRLSSVHAHKKEMKKAEKLLRKSFQLDSIWFCKKAKFLLNHFRTNELVLENKKTLFIDDISKALGDEFLNHCKFCCKENNIGSSKINNGYSTQLLNIKIDDQKHRKGSEVNWIRQDELDRKNRLKLDSLFDIHGFPNHPKVSKEAQRAAWLVLQHSTDCDWNKKWIKHWLQAKKENEYKGGEFLDQTIKRFFHPTNGYCKSNTEFINELRKRFPKDYAKEFGYDNY